MIYEKRTKLEYVYFLYGAQPGRQVYEEELYQAWLEVVDHSISGFELKRRA